MPRARFLSIISLAIIMFSLAGCDRPDDAVTSPRATRPAHDSRPVVGSRRHLRDEDPFVVFAQQVPSAAGYFLDAQKNLVAYVKDTAMFGAARNFLAARMASSELGIPRDYPHAAVTIRKADFDFQELSDWRDVIVDSLLPAFSKIVFVDLDEGHNRVTIAVDRRFASETESQIRQ